MSWVLWCLGVVAVAVPTGIVAARFLWPQERPLHHEATPIETWWQNSLHVWIDSVHKEFDAEFGGTCYLETPGEFERTFFSREVVDAIFQYEYLRDGGLDEHQSWERVFGFYDASAPAGVADQAVMIACILDSLSPGYFERYGALLERILPYVRRWVLHRMHEAKFGSMQPPAEWIRFQMAVEDIDREPVPFVRNSEEPEPFRWDQVRLKGWPRWERLKNRMVEGDELWSFSSASGSWENLCGRAGVVVLRQGRPIGDIVLLMN